MKTTATLSISASGLSCARVVHHLAKAGVLARVTPNASIVRGKGGAPMLETVRGSHGRGAQGRPSKDVAGPEGHLRPWVRPREGWGCVLGVHETILLREVRRNTTAIFFFVGRSKHDTWVRAKSLPLPEGGDPSRSPVSFQLRERNLEGEHANPSTKGQRVCSVAPRVSSSAGKGEKNFQQGRKAINA